MPRAHAEAALSGRRKGIKHKDKGGGDMNPFLKKPTLWKVGLIFLIFGIVSIVAALVGGEDSSALLFGGEFPPAAQIVGGAAVAALGMFFLVRSRKEEE